ncbi:MAG: amidohydrolase [Acidobacteriota bacterium]|nr:amidohydrolase [Acidobacteriota bacterium]
MAARLVAYLVACIVGVTLIAGLIVGAQREDDGAVDLIVVNARVYAGDGASELAEAVAVRGNKVIRVGTNSEIRRLRRAQTTVIDAKGGAVLPGFNDAHAHFISGGLSLDQVNLLEAKTLDEVRDTVRVWAESHPEREWILGRGWYYQPFTGGLPTRQILDALVPDRPAYLTAYDGHTGWANTRALKLAGITRRTKNPANGTVVKDPRTGEPTGVLKESAMQLMRAASPQPTREDKVAAIRAGLEEAHRLGVTSVQNAGGSPEDLDLYNELRKRGELTLRVYQALSADASLTDADLDRLEQVRTRFADDPLLKTGAVKLMADGVIETHTAAMLEPYANRPETKGHANFTPEQLNKVVAMLDRRGWQVMTHAIGDAAVRMALDAYEAAAKTNAAPERGRRHRIEHIETIDPADIKRFGAIGVIASMQPLHGLPSPAGDDVWSTNIGPERAARGWVWNSMARAGGKLAFGSDWPVVTIDPLMGLHVAITRTRLDGLPEGGWLPAERLPLRKAIDAYTRNAAWASYDELRKGTLSRDMLADLIVLSDDIFNTPPGRIIDAHVVVTIVDGKVVYRRDAPDTTTH